MNDLKYNICKHWDKRGDLKAIERDLARRGTDPSHPSIPDLAAADQLHVGGSESIIACASVRIGAQPGQAHSWHTKPVFSSEGAQVWNSIGHSPPGSHGSSG